MASIFKAFTDGDIQVVATPVHESIPITGSIVSGTYADANVKNYAHGMFQDVYDYPYLSSSANKICSLTVGYSSASAYNVAASVQNSKKVNIYNNMAQVLVGYDITGSILEFDEDGDILAGGTKLREVVFVNFARLLYKDEIKRGSVQIAIGTGSWADPFNGTPVLMTDVAAATDYRVNSPAGEYGILYSGVTPAGLVYYQAGVAVLTASVFAGAGMNVAEETISAVLTGSVISSSCDGLRHHLISASFNNTIEINSQIYNCSKGFNDFNYSANPTYLDTASKIRVKNVSTDLPVAYADGVGLYSSDGALLAVAKFSEIFKFSPAIPAGILCRLDY